MSIAQRLLFVFLGFYLVGLWLILLGQLGQPIVAAVLAWAASPLLLLFLRVTMEGAPGGLFAPKTQSWAFLFGDTLWLPLAFGAAAIGYSYVPGGSIFRATWWLVACVVIGVVAGIVFHAMDSAAYANAGAELALLSPTKLAHDFVAYPFLFGGGCSTSACRCWCTTSPGSDGWCWLASCCGA